MDSGKEDKAISLKEEGKFVKEWDKLRKFSHVLHRDLGGDQRHGIGHVGMEEEFARPSQKKKRKAEEEEEEKADLLSSGLRRKRIPKRPEKMVPPEWIPGYGKTWMDQNPSPYESHGTGEEDEVVEGEDNDIDDADNESEHPDVLMDSGKKSDEKEDLEELKRSLDETERQLNAQLMTFLRNNHVDTDKMLFMTRDDNNEQWSVSNGIRWRKHNKVWDPDPIF
ncbi:unnamed protein product [Bathycoccus prasinos]